MTATRQVTLWCQGGEYPAPNVFTPCVEWVQIDDSNIGYARAAAAADYGWQRRDGKDFCPKHRDPPVKVEVRGATVLPRGEP
jgi:hypothetical protein